MEKGLVALLLADATLEALVDKRIWWSRRPQNNSYLPAIVMQRISGIRETNMDGANGLVSSRVQVDAWGETYAAAKDTMNAVRDVVNGYSGTQKGTVFQLISIDSERDFNDVESDAKRLFRTSIDLSIWHDE